MNTITLAACIGAGLLAAAAPADPLIIRTIANGQLVEGGREGWSVAISDTAINGDEVLLFMSSTSYRPLEIDPTLDPPVQPVPEACFPDHIRLELGLGPWPEGNISVLGWDGDNWIMRSAIPSMYAGQQFWGTTFGQSVSTSANGEYLLVGSTGAPGVPTRDFIGIDCTVDNDLIPGPIIPAGHLDLYQWDGADWTAIATIGPPTAITPTSRVQAPMSGQPSALCACADELAVSVSQNGLGWSTAMLTFDNAGRENVLILSGMPWFDGNGAYPRFVSDPLDGTVSEADSLVGTCCLGNGTTMPGTSALDCAIAGGVIFDSAFVDCAGVTACCVGDACVGDTTPFLCGLMDGFPYPDEICDDDPCPSDITLPQFQAGESDPTACARGGAFLTLYDTLTDTFSSVSNAIDAAGNPILANGYGVGTQGLIPDPLAATGDPFPHQVMGYSVGASEHDGTIWLAVGAPFAGGVSGINAGGPEPECGLFFFEDLGIGPMDGRVLVYTLDPITLVVQHMQTLTANDPVDFMGFGTSISVSGDRMVIGAPNWQSATSSGGAAYVFEINNDGEWAQTHRLHQADADNGARFGMAVSVHDDKIVVGAPLQGTSDGSQSGSMHRYNFDAATLAWTETELLLPPQVGDAVSPLPAEQQFGRSVAITDRFVTGGGPQLVNAVAGPAGLALTTTGAIGLTDSRPIPIPPPLCMGDVDGSDTVDIRDIIIMLKGMSQPAIYPQCDVNGDSAINVMDLVDMIDRWGSTC